MKITKAMHEACRKSMLDEYEKVQEHERECQVGWGKYEAWYQQIQPLIERISTSRGEDNEAWREIRRVKQ